MKPCRSLFLFALVLFPLATGCGSGTFGILAGSDSSSSSNASTVGSDLAVTSSTGGSRPAESPALVTFLLTDQEGDPADCELTFDDGTGTRPITLAAGSPSLTQIPPGRNTVLWDFAADLGGESYEADMTLRLEVLGGISPAPVTGVDVGNDPPDIVGIEALPTDEDEYEANVDVGFTVRDTASDIVKIRVEYNDDAESGYPTASWKLARPASTPLAETTPSFAITDFATDETGVAGTFRWDTAFDLEGFDDEVLVRLTAEDAFASGPAATSGTFRIDNNFVPRVFLQEGALVTNPDDRGAITVPFTLFDEESDDVQVALQWRTNGEPFPPLPSDPETLSQILADPELRAAHRIVEELPFWAGGRVVPVDDTSVRLPELAGAASLVLHARATIAGDELEILRSGRVPEPLGLPPGVLAGPVAALPVDDGASALVLDRDGSFGWRLRQIELSSRRVLRTIASASQAHPTTMALESGGAAVLVAEDPGGSWQLQRIDLESGAAHVLAGVGGPGRLHGMTSLGRQAVLVTADGSLLRIDYDGEGEGEARSVALCDELEAPRGIALDPFSPNRVFVAEHLAAVPGGPGRVVAFDLDTHQRRVVAAKELGQPGGLPRPSALAFERDGSRLLVVTDPVPGDFQSALRVVDLGGPELGEVNELIPDLPDVPVGLACGPGSLRLLTVSSLDRLRVAGGVEQVRRITGYDPGTQVATVDAPFEPALVPGRGWRWSKTGAAPFKTAPQGASGFLIWNSADIPGGGEVDLRLTAFDSDPGNSQVSAVAKVVRDSFDVEPVRLGLTITRSFASGDLNGDGLLDVVAADPAGFGLAVFHASSPGVFPSSPDLVLGGRDTTPSPSSVFVADLNDDGRLDIVASNVSVQGPDQSQSSLTVFTQDESGFTTAPLVLGEGALYIPAAVIAADWNCDGRLDVLCSNQVGGSDAERGLLVFLQEPGGGFSTAPDDVLDYPAADFVPGSLAAGHLDDDDRIDLAVADAGAGGRLIVFYASGGTQALDTPARPASLVTADVDDDGRMDLVSANFDAASSSLTVFFQQEDGRFPELPGVTLQDPSLFRIPAGLGVADVDGDARIDIFAGNRATDSVVVFFQREARVFSTEDVRVLRVETTDVYAVGAADWNGDGILDLGAAAVGELELFLQAGPPRPLRASPSLVVSWGGSFSAQSSTGDLDADGLPDLVLSRVDSSGTGPQRGELGVFFQSGAGQFPASPDLVLASFAGFPRSVAAVDLNGDGRVDLATANSPTQDLPGSNLTVFFQDTTGGFPEDPDLTLGGPSWMRNPLALTAADLNADGRIDLATANFGLQNEGDTLTLFFQTEDEEARFRTIPSRTLGGSDRPGGYNALDSCDLNGDGKADLVASHSGGSLGVFYQFGVGGSYSQEPDWTHDLSSFGSMRHVACADLNGDGLTDLAAAHAEGVALFFQSKPTSSEPGGFPGLPSLTLAQPPATDFARFVSTGDLNADGLTDLAVAAGTAVSGITVFPQTSPGRFDAAASYFLPGDQGGQPFSMSLTDLSNDGQLDLVSSSSGRLNVHLSE